MTPAPDKARNPDTPRLWRRPVEWIGGSLEWSPVEKAMLGLGLVFPFLAGYDFRFYQLASHPEIEPYISREWVSHIRFLNQILMAACLFLGAIGSVIRKRNPGSYVFSLLSICLLFTAGTLVTWALGPYTSPSFIAFLLVAIIAFLLFEHSAVFAGIGLYTVSLVALTIGERLEVIPYAPLLKGQPYIDGRLSNEWVIGNAISMIMGSLFALAVYRFVLVRWRDREGKLTVAYQELSRAKDELVRAESLAAVGSLVTGAAHELRNPLASSSALFQSLRDDIEVSSATAPEKQEALQTIEMALRGQRRAALIVERLYRLTDDLVTHKSSVPLGESLDGLDKSCPGLQTAIAPDLRTLRVPHAFVGTVLPNLIDNARAAGGAQPPRVDVTANDGTLQIVVSDSGRGIPKSMQPEVFKPFFTGQKAGEGHGVGLGLYIVHELVNRMGGKVNLDSEEGKGTRIGVSIPLAGLQDY